ncbi:MAG: GH36-type glycosyl hydrolase domain-containing protein, partial [Candidatus Krumholzibacteriia bacterium]
MALAGWSGTWHPTGGGFTLWLRDRDDGRFAALGDPDGPATAPWRLEPGLATLAAGVLGLRAELVACVAADGPTELRRLTLTNPGPAPRRVEVTTCVEAVLHDPRAHAAHPVFAKLFLQTERDPATGALLLRRRARDPHEQWPWLVHACLDGEASGWETDRARFQGRGRPRGRPAALATRDPLSGTCGNVLDPVLSLRRELTLAPGASATVTWLLGAAADRGAALALVAERDGTATIAAARTAGADRLQRLGLDFAQYAWAQTLGAAALLADAGLRAPRPALTPGPETPSALLSRVGLDPRLPLAVLDAGRGRAHLPRLRLAVRVWQELGLPLQLAVLDGDGEEPAPGLVPIPAAALSAADRLLLTAAARLFVAEHLPAPAAPASLPPDLPAPPAAPAAALALGSHGFSEDGDEYVIRLARGADGFLALPPQPWVNVMANEDFGCLVSETGAGATWAANSREHRLTPWRNDPVRDPHQDALLVRPRDGEVFSCLPGPEPGAGAYELRHGFGYTRCRYTGGGLLVDTRVFVARVEPVRCDLVRITNTGDQPRHLTLAAWRTLVPGGDPADDGPLVQVTPVAAGRLLLVRNPAAGIYAGRVAFAAVVAGPGCTAARGADTGAAGLPRVEQATDLVLGPGESAAAAFLLGEAGDEAAARALAASLDTIDACEAAWQEARAFWRDGLAGLQVTTPAPALDRLANGWLAYQTLSCRIRGRTACYQSGGAYGFRDQLQDAMALLPYWPERVREQILIHAAHQFVEGDVLHWWHPPGARGLRTRFADDLLWLPYLTAEYAATTGDAAILDEVAPYRTARLLEPGEDEAFLATAPADEQGPVYEHCCRAVDRSLATGAHGLPLFGTGDWNDGMNRAGREGRGESVWMGFFLVAVIDAFAPWCEARGDGERAARYRGHRDELAAALNDGGWDGDYYRRGYYDDGAPLGTHLARECRIDGLVQAWSVLSKVAPPERARQALDAIERHLVDERHGLIRLLTPPFVDTPHDPGYIKGYVAGVRENGGQYTHAALWMVRAMAEAGRRERAAPLLEMLCPLTHTATPEGLARYQVEPYVVAADVYGAPPHEGRGGWTWYTGSSG